MSGSAAARTASSFIRLRLPGRQAACPAQPSRRRMGRSASSAAGSSIVDGTASSAPSAMPRMVFRRILPDLVADQLDEFGAQRVGVGVAARFEHNESAGDLAFEWVMDADDGAFGNGGMAG